MKIFVIICIFLFASAKIYGQISNNDSLVTDVSNASLDQDDPSVSIDRKNPNVIVVGASSDYTDMDANGISAYTSVDTGKTWSLFRLPLPPDQLYNYGEASVTSDNSGNFYYAYITNDGVDSGGSIVIATSQDGKIWKNAAPINNNPAPNHYGSPDGVFITADNSPSSSHPGRVYVVWDQFYSADSLSLSQGAYISWSDNQCNTWSKPKLIGATDDYQMVRTGKNGEVYVVMSDSANLGHQIFVSTDGGATFASKTISGFTHYPFITAGAYAGLTGLKGNQGILANPYPSIDIDINTNRIHCVYGDYIGNVATQYYSHSDDNGSNWSAPQIIGINLLDSADRFDPSVSVDSRTGDASVIFYSSEADPQNSLVAPYRLMLTENLADQGQMLSPEFNPLIVEESSTTPPYIGDHTSSDAFGGVYAGSWTQNRPGFTDGDIFVYIAFPSPKNSVGIPVIIRSQQPWLSQAFPNPCYGSSISLQYYLPHQSNVGFDLYDESGRKVEHLINKLIDAGSYTDEFNLGNISSGTYFIKMLTIDGEMTQKIIVDRK